MDAPTFIFFLAMIGIVICVVNDKQKKKKDAEMLAQLSPDDRNRILAERAEKQRQAAERAKQLAAANQQAQKEAMADLQHGSKNPAMVCPHCQTKGHIRTKQITQKKGVSGSKAAAAVVTGGLSVLAVGLARKEASTQARCGNCGNTWLF